MPKGPSGKVKAKPEDYIECESCDALVARKHLRREKYLFSGERWFCPAGHDVSAAVAEADGE